MFFFFFKQKTAYDMRISDWSSDVCSSDLHLQRHRALAGDDIRIIVRMNQRHTTLADQLGFKKRVCVGERLAVQDHLATQLTRVADLGEWRDGRHDDEDRKSVV